MSTDTLPRKILFIALVVVLFGCSRGEQPEPRDESSVSITRLNARSASLSLVELKDGSRCMVYHGYGISCDWSKK